MTLTARSAESFNKDNWSDAELQNATLVLEFVQLVMNAHDFETARERFGTSPYLQHNRSIPDGVEGLTGYLETLTRRFPEYQYDVKHVYVDGEYVTLQSHATLKAKHRGNQRKGLNIIDTWRVVDGRLTEHWDALQSLSTSMALLGLVSGRAARHSNPVF